MDGTNMKCLNCKETLIRNQFEPLWAFDRRMFCDGSCAGKYVHPKKRPEAKIIKMKLLRKNHTLKQIGDIFEITPERVRQLLAKY